MAAILITAYLIIGAVAFAFIWIALIASKHRQEKTSKGNFGSLKYKLFHEPNTKPSRFHL